MRWGPSPHAGRRAGELLLALLCLALPCLGPTPAFSSTIRLHYEDAFAASVGVGKPIVHGLLKHAWLIQLVTSWMGDDGFMKRFSCQYRGLDYPRLMKSMNEPQDGETWLCKGKVANKYVDGGDHCVDLEVGVENGKGQITTPGTATVVLPSRG